MFDYIFAKGQKQLLSNQIKLKVTKFDWIVNLVRPTMERRETKMSADGSEVESPLGSSYFSDLEFIKIINGHKRNKIKQNINQVPL